MKHHQKWHLVVEWQSMISTKPILAYKSHTRITLMHLQYQTLLSVRTQRLRFVCFRSGDSTVDNRRVYFPMFCTRSNMSALQHSLSLFHVMSVRISGPDFCRLIISAVFPTHPSFSLLSLLAVATNGFI